MRTRPREWPPALRQRAHEIRGKYRFGDELIARMLAAEFGVSITRNSVRRILEQKP